MSTADDPAASRGDAVSRFVPESIEARLIVEPVGPGHHRWVAPHGWQQGKGVYGGLALGAMIRAADRHVVGVEQPLRTFSASLYGPVLPGESRIESRVLRAGSGTTAVAVELSQQGQSLYHGVAVYGRSRAPDFEVHELFPPILQEWESVSSMEAPEGAAPQFTRHFEYRPTRGFPFSGADTPDVEGWFRPVIPLEAPEAAHLAALVDAWWPGALSQFDSPRPMVTLSFFIQFLGDLASLPPQDPLGWRSSMKHAQDGYSVEFRELWGGDGRLLALNQQSIVIVR